MANYWKPSIPRSLYEKIKTLFVDKPEIGKLYSNNPAELLREALRDKIKSLENNYLESEPASENLIEK